MKYLLATAAVLAALGTANAENRHDVGAYSTAFLYSSSAFKQSLQDIKTGCSSGSVACHDSLAAGTHAVHAFMLIMYSVRVPECLRSSDDELHRALKLYDNAYSVLSSAFGHDDTDQANVGLKLLLSAGNAMTETLRLTKISEVECLK